MRTFINTFFFDFHIVKRQTRVTVKCYDNADEIPTELVPSLPMKTTTNSLYTAGEELTTTELTTLQTSSPSDFFSSESSHLAQEESTTNDDMVHPSDSESDRFEKSDPSRLWIGEFISVYYFALGPDAMKLAILNYKLPFLLFICGTFIFRYIILSLFAISK